MKLQLLDLPEKVLTRVNSQVLSEGHCRHISKLVNKKEHVGGREVREPFKKK